MKDGLPVHAPHWADTIFVIDDSVEYSRRVGHISSSHDHELVTVDVVQRCEQPRMGETSEHALTSACVRIAGIRVSLDEARDLAEHLATAVSLLQAGKVESPTQPASLLR